MTILQRLPYYYRSSAITSAITSVCDTVSSAVISAVADLPGELLGTCAFCILPRWETIFGLPSYGTTADRRARILAARASGGTSTVADLRAMLDGFGFGVSTVSVSGLSVSIWFDTLGVPPMLSDMDRAIRDMIPAHIAFAIIPQYRTIGDFAGNAISWANMTMQQLSEWSD